MTEHKEAGEWLALACGLEDNICATSCACQRFDNGRCIQKEAAKALRRLAATQLAVSFTAKQYHHMRTCLANERNAVQDQLDKCRADAFEECAKIAEEKYVDISWHGYYRMAANGIAGKIRRSALTEAAMKSVSDAHWPDPH